MMSNARPDIPADIKRQVRKACGFGCVICGLPIFHYDHIDDYAEFQGHTVDNLTLLCPTHHQDKTSKRLPREKVRAARSRPVNLTRLTTAPERWYFDGPSIRFLIGSNLFEFDTPTANLDERSAILIADETVFGFRLEQGEALLSVRLHDELGQDILVIDSGEVTVSTQVFDYDIVGPNLRIRDAERSVLVDLVKGDDRITVRRGRFRAGGTELEVAPSEVIVMPHNFRMSGCTSSGCRIGLAVG